MRRLLAVTFFTGVLTLFKMIAGFIIAKIVAVYTGPTGMVLLGQIQSIVTGLNGIVNAPVGSGVVRYTAENLDNGIDDCIPWWRASIRWGVILISILIPMVLIISPYLAKNILGNSEYTWIIIVTALALPFGALGTFIISILNGFQKYKIYVLLGLLSTFISTLVMVALIFLKGISGALVAVAIQYAIVGMVMAGFINQQKWFFWKNVWGKAHRYYMRGIGGYILMAITSAVIAPISLILIRNIIIHYSGWSEAGYWQAVWKISETYLLVITLALGTYFLPRLTTLKNNVEIFNEVNKTALLIFPIVCCCSLMIFLLRDTIISLLFTKDFQVARMFFPVQLIGDILKIISWVYAYVMISKGMTKTFIFSEILFGALFVLLAFVFVKQYGTIGASFAYVLNYFFYFLFSFLLIYFNRNKNDTPIFY
ncbi:oligosaccharide flippase family protein [Citrobacter braakii]|uniref:O-antigen translocase n=1 Tax=Citrobacter TaxID=544 RepID=UPI0012995EAF|nr:MULTISPECIES: O-antigen translocase [Citrobacter]MDU2945043.1 O-antigen translocase [Citrobacter sp.]QGG14110.1 oligosaccharide flippase family protein [Citrobacter braakii]WFW23771.1 O-antigen translocase [Citrobacter braakii]